MNKQEKDSLFDDSELHPDAMSTRQVASEFNSESLFDDSELHPEASVSKVESAIRGAASGYSAGFDDELAGVLSAAFRPLGVKGLGGKLSDIELDSPTLDLETITNEYSRVRDAERNANTAASKANPGTFLTADVASSILSPVNKLAIGGQLPKAAGFVGRTANTVKNFGKVLPVAAAETIGRSEASNAEEWTDDLLTGAAVTAAVPAGFQAIGEAGRIGKKGVDLVIHPELQDFVRRAYDLGKEGVVTTTKEFAEESKRKLVGLAETISSPLHKKAKEIAQMRKARLMEEVKEVDGLIKTNSSKIDQITNSTKGQVNEEAQREIRRLENEMTQAKINLKKKNDSVIASEEKVKNIEYNDSQKSLEEVTANTQNKVYKAKQNIKEEYNHIDKELTDKEFIINTNELVANIRDNLELSGIDTEAAEKMLKVVKTYDGDLTFAQFQQLKQELENLGDSAAKKNPAVSAVFREAFGKSKTLQLETIKNIPELAPVAQRLSNNNLKYTGFMNASKYLDDVRLHSFAKDSSGTKVLAAAPLTAKRIKRLASVEAADSIENKDLIDSLRLAGVDESDIKKMVDVSEMVQKVESRQIARPNITEEAFLDPEISKIKSDIDSIRRGSKDASDAISQNPEVQRMRELIEQYRVQKAGIKNTPLTPMEQRFKPYDDSLPDLTRNKTSDLFENNASMENKASDFVKEEQLFEDLSSIVGPEEAERLALQKQQNVQDVNLGRLMTAPFKESSITKPGLIRTFTGGLAKPLVNISNKVGLKGFNNSTLLNSFNALRGKDSLTRMTRTNSVVQAISDDRKYTPINEIDSENLNAMSQNLQNSNDVTNKHMAEKLDKAAKGDRYQKAATNFDLMQTEAGRKLLNKK